MPPPSESVLSLSLELVPPVAFDPLDVVGLLVPLLVPPVLGELLDVSEPPTEALEPSLAGSLPQPAVKSAAIVSRVVLTRIVIVGPIAKGISQASAW